MKNHLIIPAVAFMLIISSCSTETKKEVQKVEDSKSAFVLKKQGVSLTLNLPAELLPYETAEIHAKVDGYVQSVLADIGDKVKKGQVLARLDAPEVIAQSAQASSKYYEVQARFMASQDKYRRIQTAAKQQGVISESEVINAKNQMLADSAALNSAKSTERAFKQLQEYLTIRTPFAGVVTSRFINQGDFVGNAGKSAMFVLEYPEKLRLRVYVPEANVGNIPANDTLQFTVDAMVNKTFPAILSRKSGSINRDTRTELWEYEYDNKNGELKSGMYTTVKLNLNRPADTFVVPFPAMVTSLEKRFVIRIKNGEAEWVDVREGISTKDGKEIFGNMNEGDTILARGSEEIKPGTKLNIKVQ
jgi:membrane fusion protein, multidrug efflux system